MKIPKFRIWSPKYKKFWYIELGDTFYFKKTDIICQYTGLQDKNGKEIYEGDIIKYQDVDRNGDYYVKICPVEWDENNAGFDPLDRYGIIARECEVIGNIYENPQEAK